MPGGDNEQQNDGPKTSPREGFWQRELTLRIIFGVIMVLVTLGVLSLGFLAFVVYAVVIAALMLFEWRGIVGKFDGQHKAIAVTGTLLILLCGASAIAIEVLYSVLTIAWALALVWATDIGAFFVGRQVGGPKFAPKISPKKTWSGVIGGIAFALVMSCVWWWIAQTTLPTVSLPKLLWVSLVASIASIFGDLFESHAKRLAGVKDSGNMIPGHGGFLDRLDGAMFALPVVCFSLLGGRLI